MLYAGFMLRRERLKRNWSQEGLCKGICTISYLSKIEQGKAEPSEEILHMLMERMGLVWHTATDDMDRFIRHAYELLFSFEDGLGDFMAKENESHFIFSPYGPDWALLKSFSEPASKPFDAEFEVCMNNRQLALNRLLQHRGQEAICLYPIGFVYYIAGIHEYNAGRCASALEMLQTAFQLAAQEGRPRLMMYCKVMMGNCYSNLRNSAAMEQHYEVAERLARALDDTKFLSSISYNRAATYLEMGNFRKALAYFENIAHPTRMDLHKLAICYEKLGCPDKAIAALDRSQTVSPSPGIPGELEKLLLEIVRMRVCDHEYIKNAEYGEKLLLGFDLCRKHLPSGYAQFHLPWVLEWYESNRQYKQALEVLRSFPDTAANR